MTQSATQKRIGMFSVSRRYTEQQPYSVPVSHNQTCLEDVDVVGDKSVGHGAHSLSGTKCSGFKKRSNPASRRKRWKSLVSRKRRATSAHKLVFRRPTAGSKEVTVVKTYKAMPASAAWTQLLAIYSVHSLVVCQHRPWLGSHTVLYQTRSRT